MARYVHARSHLQLRLELTPAVRSNRGIVGSFFMRQESLSVLQGLRRLHNLG